MKRYQRFDQLVAAWKQAAVDLAIEIVAPYVLATPGHPHTEYVALVKHFGRSKDMVLLPDAHDRQAVRLAESHGFGWSCLSPMYRKYERSAFIEALSDWGWTGLSQTPPAWYTKRT